MRRALQFAIFAIFTIAPLGNAQTEAGNVWVFTGAVDADWFNGNNWNNGTVPSAEHDVRIEANCLMDSKTRYGNCRTLTVAPGVELQVLNGSSVRVAKEVSKGQHGTITLSNGGSIAAPRNAFWVWLAIGFAGQLFFTLRMVAQWVASERVKQSIVPRIYWFLSIAGSVLLLSYAIFRKDIVIIFGQAFGTFVYVRNLMLGKSRYQQKPNDEPQAA